MSEHKLKRGFDPFIRELETGDIIYMNKINIFSIRYAQKDFFISKWIRHLGRSVYPLYYRWIRQLRINRIRSDIILFNTISIYITLSDFLLL